MTRQEAAMMIENDIRIHHDDLSGNYRKALRMAISALQQPEIIHCQYCKYARENQGESWICTNPDNNAWRITEDFYCGRAERREE